jgi:site-specific DNA-methyltransferase (adenine-specific)
LFNDNRTRISAGLYGEGNWIEGSNFSDKGGASRFFYCPKPSKKEKEEGLKSFQVKSSGIGSTYAGNQNSSNISGNPERKTNPKKNFHPTVKPKALMQYLIRLVTPKNGTTIDPFFGSGTSGISTLMEGNYKFIGIEKEKEYFDISVERCQYEYNKSLKQAA